MPRKTAHGRPYLLAKRTGSAYASGGALRLTGDRGSFSHGLQPELSGDKVVETLIEVRIRNRLG